jgi:hypothetical protein
MSAHSGQTVQVPGWGLGVARVVLNLAQHGVTDGREVHRQPEQSCGGVFCCSAGAAAFWAVEKYSAGYPALVVGGPWLRRISPWGLRASVVPSACRMRVQPRRWMQT